MEPTLYGLVVLSVCMCFCSCNSATSPSNQSTTSQLDRLEGMLGHIQNNMVLLGGGLQNVKDDLKVVKSEQQAIKKGLDQVKSEQQAIKVEIEGMKTDFQLMKNDISRIKTDQQDLKLEVDRIKTDKQSIWAQIDQMKQDQRDLKTYLSQRDKAVEDKIEMALTTGRQKTGDPTKMLAKLEALNECRKNNDFRPIEDIIDSLTPTVHRNCEDALNAGWRTSGMYKVNPDGHGERTVYCEQELCGGGLMFETASDFRPSLADIKKNPHVFMDCQDAHMRGCRDSGIYTISPDNSTKMDVYCEQHLDGGGWTVFQKRMNGDVDFYRTWADYKVGFGNVTTEYWLGNDALHILTKDKDQVLKVELTHPNGQVAYADYSTFYIDNEADKYKLHVSGFSGANPPGDSLAYHNNKAFVTKDSDTTGKCAQSCKGAWWYDNCQYSNLNGEYNGGYHAGVNWYHWGNSYKISMSKTRMMIRQKE